MLVLAKFFLRLLVIVVIVSFAFSFIFNRWIDQDGVGLPQDLAQTGEFISVGDIDYYFIDAGVGPKTFILLHDYGSSSYTWRYMTDALAREGRVLAIDLAGFGFSTKNGDIDYSIDARVDRLHTLLELLKVDDDFTFIGHGFGGKLALTYSLTYGSQVQDIILFAPDAYPTSRVPGFFFSTPEISKAGYKLFNSDTRIIERYKSFFVNPSKLTQEDFDAYVAPYNTQGAEDAYLQMYKTKDSRTDYSNVVRPVLILYGEQDTIVDRFDMERLRADVYSGRVVTIDGAGHMLQEEIPGVLLEQLQAFIVDPERNRDR